MFVRLRYMFCREQIWKNLQPRKAPTKSSQFVLYIEKIYIGVFHQNLSCLKSNKCYRHVCFSVHLAVKRFVLVRTKCN
jgi:hypothetical protein